MAKIYARKRRRRKSNMKTKVLIYCTKGKNKAILGTIFKGNWEKVYHTTYSKYVLENCVEDDEILNGKIVAECEVETEEIFGGEYCYRLAKSKDVNFQLESCLDYDTLDSYLKGNNGYALHISNLKIFDEPLEIPSNELLVYSYKNDMYLYLKKAPMNMCWVFHNREWKVLISIRPQWVCKILNGEKKIEVRRKVLKGMCE